MNLTSSLFDAASLWRTDAAGYNPAGRRLEGFSAEDHAALATAFPPSAGRCPCSGPLADPMGRFRLDATGAVEWVPPILSCGYHDPVAISVEIDAESGGGFVTRPALPAAVAGGDVFARLVRRVRSFVPRVQGVEVVDVHAVRLSGGSSWTTGAIPTARATAVVMVRPAPTLTPRPAPPAWGPAKLRRPFDLLAWTSPCSSPRPGDTVEGGAGDVLLIAFRG